MSALYSQPKDDLDRLTRVQSEHLQSDELVISTLNKKNELESFIYAWKPKLEGSHKPYVQPELANSILAKLAENETWLYDAGSDSTLHEYHTRLEEVKALIAPIDHRLTEYTQLP